MGTSGGTPAFDSASYALSFLKLSWREYLKLVKVLQVYLRQGVRSLWGADYDAASSELSALLKIKATKNKTKIKSPDEKAYGT